MVFLNGQAIPEPDTRGQQTLDDHFLIIFNGHHGPLPFVLPDENYGKRWVTEVDTAATKVPTAEHKPGDTVKAQGRSVIVLRCPRDLPSGSPAGAAAARR
jgi:glycogen operon protein